MIWRQKDYPKTLLVNGQTWRVRFFRIPPIQERPSEEIMGVCVPATKTIWLKQGQPPSERFSTFVHEVTHAIEREHGIEIPHWVVEKMEGPIAAFLRENPLVPMFDPPTRPRCSRRDGRRSAKRSR